MYLLLCFLNYIEHRKLFKNKNDKKKMRGKKYLNLYIFLIFLVKIL